VPLKHTEALNAGLTATMIEDGVREAYRLLDAIDRPLYDSTEMRLADVVELANLSSIIGNLLAVGIVGRSGGVYGRAGAHKYQDLRATDGQAEVQHVEIKVALEDNRPKGHLPKPGFYLACRYVLGGPNGEYDRGQRGKVVWIWELRFGELAVEDFSVSNTDGDSGKTAVVSTAGMKKLTQIYFDEQFCPVVRIERYVREYGGRWGA
jgi:hypothetical protein